MTTKAAITIHVQAANAPNLYAWNTNGELCGGWPGTALSETKEVKGTTFFFKTFEVEELNIIFNNNGGGQTGNIEGIKENAFFTYDGNNGYQNVTDQYVETPVQKNPYSVTFVNGEKWEQVYAYTYNPELSGSWPGTQLSKTGTTTLNGADYDVYTYAFEAVSAPANIIFNSGVGGTQTADLTFEDGKTYDVTVPVYATIETVQFVGDFNDWSEGTMTKSDDYIWTTTLVLSDTSIVEFKLLVNGDKWIGANQMSIEAPELWIESTEDGGNLTLMNNQTGFESYAITATWQRGESATEGWTLKIEGLDKRVDTGIKAIDTAIGEGARIYNMQGVRVDGKVKKGIYIVGGKKYAVR